MSRTDAHRPSAIVPADYTPRMCYSLATMVDGWPVPAIGIEQVIAMTAAAHDAGFEVFGSPGQCGVCGARFVYGELWQHDPTKALVHMGHDCAGKYNMLMDRSAWELENGRVRAAAAKACMRSKNDEARAKFLAAHEGLAEDFALGDERFEAPRNAKIIADIKARFVKWHSVSDKQIALVAKLANELRNPAPPKPEELHVTAPTGKGITFEGTIVSAKLRESDYGTTWKITVKVSTDAGSWLAWGTAPRMLLDAAVELADLLDRAPVGPGERVRDRSELIRSVLVGRKVELKATLERPAARDASECETDMGAAQVEKRNAETHFAFMSRPSGTFSDVVGMLPRPAPKAPRAPRKPKLCPVCQDGACETKSEDCGK